MTQVTKPVLLIIRDGWGRSHDASQDGCNAVKQARTPSDDALRAKFPSTEIAASGLDVGVPAGVMGNSEVGHQNIGAGRIVDQEIVRISKAMLAGEVAGNAAWEGALQRARQGGKLHLMGIASDAGVHGLLEHLFGLLRLARDSGLSEVYIHAFTDGRDTPPHSGLGYLEAIEKACAEIGIGRIATVCGRFWSMDRDRRWERVEKAYRCLTGQKAEATARSAAEAVRRYYDQPLDASRKGDEFVLPTWIVDESGVPLATIGDGDAVVFYNFRGDRPRELTEAFVLPEFDGFERGARLDLFYATLTEYKAGLPVQVIFRKPKKLVNILAEYLAERGVAQFRCAETEKFPHVTFFFNDYREEPFPGEDRTLIPSPKVPTYDLQPEMSEPAVTEAARKAILSGKYGFLLVNYANPDMVGHTGSLPAAIRAVEAVDRGVGVLLQALDSVGGKAVITADHGNAEQMWDPASQGPHTSHTLNPVELYVVGEDCQGLRLRRGGRLADVAPTILDLMGLPIPPEMTGLSLIER